MHATIKEENAPAPMVTYQSLGAPRSQSAYRSRSPSPPPVSIRKHRPFQSLNSNQLSRRAFGDDKENQCPTHVAQRPSEMTLGQTNVILQPPPRFGLSSEGPQSQSALHSLISKPSIQQAPLALIPLSAQWTPNQNCAHAGRVGNVAGVQCNPNNFSSYTREEMEEAEVDPFAQLSARTLALMDQPESEVTIYDCEYCDKTYQGKHARSIWRRHLSDKHKIPLSTQPRRTRWDNDANRPKTEEERRERTLESKRRWARKNRAAKKAARDGQMNTADQSAGGNHSESLASGPYRPSPNRSQAPSPLSFPVSLGHTPFYSTSTAQFVRSQSSQVENRGPGSAISRGSSVPHAFAPYPTLASRGSISFGDSSYSSPFGIAPVAPAPEWAFPMPCPYSFETVAPSGHSPGQLSDCLTNEGIQHSHSPRTFHNLSRRHTLNHAPENQQVDQRLPECYSGAPLTSQYGNWDGDGRINIPSSLPINLAQVESSSYETNFKRPRLSSSASVIELQKSYSACHLKSSSVDSRDFQPSSTQDSTQLSLATDVPPVNLKASPVGSVRDEPADGDLAAISEEHASPAPGQDEFQLNSPTPYTNGDDDGQRSRPATSGTLSSMSHENEVDRVIPMNRAATEPQFALRYDLQTPSLTRSDSNPASFYHSQYAPMSTSKRTLSEYAQPQSFSGSGPLGMGDWSNQALETPSGFSRFPFNNNMLSSPAGTTGIFGSPTTNLSKSLGLSLNGSVPGEDCLGGFLAGAASTWDMVHQQSS